MRKVFHLESERLETVPQLVTAALPPVYGDAMQGGACYKMTKSDMSHPICWSVSAAEVYDHWGNREKIFPIPPPGGPLSKPKSGGYSLKEVLKWDPAMYRETQNALHHLCHQHLDITRTYNAQSSEATAAFLQTALSRFPFLSLYDSQWPAQDFAAMYLKNMTDDESEREKDSG
ncbi:hypothetical protein BJ138DRAFT_1119115 [Hygrophoropsis aurantiaca]|uniref:Uncharacterized protein n=1 Tax=Hygrophoropsis aurantiaca TaxID=72124 RepID=A0ACB7ZUL6_9AGAM|nr:hypothetical protein BJ138DRAFT_1119115 [Hygrophoropsis aurantiaca]